MAEEPPEAQRLPAGHHGIPPELVARNQRERLIAAMAEACAEKGYAEVAVADLVSRAGVSTATFYKRFDSKLECLLVAHAELFARLLDEIDAACASAPEGAEVRGAVALCLELLAADAPSARLLTVEILAAGTPGSRLYAKSVGELARRLSRARSQADGAGAEVAVDDAEWARAASLIALVARQIMAGQAAALPELEEQLLRIALA